MSSLLLRAHCRLLCYFTVLSLLGWITIAIRHRYYLHLHHWFLGVLLMPLSHTSSPLLSLAAIGFCGAQFVEGAAKWCVHSMRNGSATWAWCCAALGLPFAWM